MYSTWEGIGYLGVRLVRGCKVWLWDQSFEIVEAIRKLCMPFLCAPFQLSPPKPSAGILLFLGWLKHPLWLNVNLRWRFATGKQRKNHQFLLWSITYTVNQQTVQQKPPAKRLRSRGLKSETLSPWCLGPWKSVTEDQTSLNLGVPDIFFPSTPSTNSVLGG